MKKFLLHPITVTIVTVVFIAALPYMLPKKPIPKWSDEELRSKALSLNMLPTPKSYEELLKVVNNPQNPLSREKIALGKRLYFDTRLSRDKSISCASCHILEQGGDDNRPTAIGYRGRANPHHLNSPTVLNAALAKYQFWDGRAKDVEEQAAGPVQAPFEMNMTPKEVEERLNSDSSLRAEFKKVFGKDRVEFSDVQKAIGAYERTLLTRGAYDEFLDGNNSAISESAKRGMTLFISKGCKGCHTGMSVGGQLIQKFPVRFYWQDYLGVLFNPKVSIKDNPYPFKNLGEFYGRNNEQYFRVPILRNITKTAPYFHNGAVKDIKEAVRIMSKYQLGDEFNKEQIADVVEFLKTLEGKIVKY